MIAAAQQEGLDVTCSVDVAHLLYSDESLLSLDTNYKLVPPLRNETDREALIAGVLSGVITSISSHHLPVHQDHKLVEFDQAHPGMVMLQTAIPALLTLVPELDLATITRALCGGPAKVLGLPTPKIAIGNSANLTVLDLGAMWEYTNANNKSATDNSQLLNTSLKGTVVLTVRH